MNRQKVVLYEAMSKNLVLIILLALYAAGCASAPPRFSLLAPASEIKASKRFVVAPASVIHNYITSGDPEMDAYLSKHDEIWQQEIMKHLQSELGKDRIAGDTAAGFEKLLKDVLKKEGKEGFINPNTGQFDNESYKHIMAEMAGQYDATLIIPTLEFKNASISHPFGEVLIAPKAKWDGVARKVETGGSKAMRLLGGFNPSGGSKLSGSVPVYSLHAECYTKKGLVFWGNGGFDIKSKVGFGFLSPKEVKRDIGELYKDNQKYIEESIKVAFEPLFSKSDGTAAQSADSSNSDKAPTSASQGVQKSDTSKSAESSVAKSIPGQSTVPALSVAPIPSSGSQQATANGKLPSPTATTPVKAEAPKATAAPSASGVAASYSVSSGKETYSAEVYSITNNPTSVPPGTYPEIKGYVQNISSTDNGNGGKAIFDIKVVLTYPNGKNQTSWWDDVSFEANQKKVYPRGNNYDTSQVGTYTVEYSAYTSDRGKLLSSRSKSFTVQRP